MNALNWRLVFDRWLTTRLVLDRIDFADVRRWPGQHGGFAQSGPVVKLTKEIT